jgi:hypothetical protein
MIDMRLLYHNTEYSNYLTQFQNSFTTECNYRSWAIFKPLHLTVTNNRCPICECNLDGSVTRMNSSNNPTSLKAQIDHFRPIDLYSFLKCDDENYLVMCSDCNNVYKGGDFPLYQNQNRAQNKIDIANENPLLVNPISDDIFELFDLVFKRTSSNKNVLELKPKRNLDTNSYLYRKAQNTITTFGLGNCSSIDENNNVQKCRIDIVESHFGIFYDLARALLNGEKTTVNSLLNEHELIYKSYGFFEFLKKKQFIDLVI